MEPTTEDRDRLMVKFYSEAVESKAIALASMLRAGLPDRSARRVDKLRDIATVQGLCRADSYWVDDDIWTTIAQSSATLPMDFVLDDSLAPSTSGWIWLESPWQVPHGEVPNEFEPYGFKPHAVAIMWGFGVGHSNGLPILNVETFHRSVDGHILPFYFTYAQVGRTLTEEEDRRRVEFEALGRPDNCAAAHAIMRIVLSAFLWMKQTICVATPVGLERHARKRLARVEMVKSISVIALRRKVYDGNHGDASGEPVEWSCRWLVRGHWRQQYHPSTGRREPLFILPHVKGPDDKPFKAAGPTIRAVIR